MKLDKSEEAVKVGNHDSNYNDNKKDGIEIIEEGEFVITNHQDKTNTKMPTTVIKPVKHTEKYEEEYFDYPAIPPYFSKRQKVIQQSFSSQELQNRCQPDSNSIMSSTTCADITMVTQLSYLSSQSFLLL